MAYSPLARGKLFGGPLRQAAGPPWLRGRFERLGALGARNRDANRSSLACPGGVERHRSGALYPLGPAEGLRGDPQVRDAGRCAGWVLYGHRIV